MCRKTRVKKTHVGKQKKGFRYRRRNSTTALRLHYTFLILFLAMVLAGIAFFLHIEAPIVWTFLLGVGNWVALTNILGRNLK
jgi:hypothetical protein